MHSRYSCMQTYSLPYFPAVSIHIICFMFSNSHQEIPFTSMLVNVLPLTPTRAQSEVLMQLWYPKRTTLEIIHLVSPQWLRPYVSRSLTWWIRSTVQSEKQKVSFRLGLNSVRRCCTSHTMMVIVTAWVLSSTGQAIIIAVSFSFQVQPSNLLHFTTSSKHKLRLFHACTWTLVLQS